MTTIQIELRSIHEAWKIIHNRTIQSRTSIKRIEPYQMLIQSKQKNFIPTLEKWLKKKASRHLGNWLHALSEDFELQYNNLTIRGQRSRWGSCSEDKAINLNYKLLFLPANLVEHILLHELCHTKELNHSQDFWHLMSKHDVNYKQNRKLLLQADKYLPNWAR